MTYVQDKIKSYNDGLDKMAYGSFTAVNVAGYSRDFLKEALEGAYKKGKFDGAGEALNLSQNKEGGNNG